MNIEDIVAVVEDPLKHYPTIERALEALNLVYLASFTPEELEHLSKRLSTSSRPLNVAMCTRIRNHLKVRADHRYGPVLDPDPDDVTPDPAERRPIPWAKIADLAAQLQKLSLAVPEARQTLLEYEKLSDEFNRLVMENRGKY